MSMDDMYEQQYQQEKRDRYVEYQRMLHEFGAKILTLKNDMEIIKNNYQNQIDMMESRGLVQEIVNPIREKYQTFSLKVEHLEDMIDRHSQKVSDQNEILQGLILMALIGGGE